MPTLSADDGTYNGQDYVNNSIVATFTKTSHAQNSDGKGERWEQSEVVGTRNVYDNGDSRTQECVVQGVDCYNQTVTGETATTVRSTASDSDHIPCVVNCYDRSTRARNPEANGDLSPTLLGFAGTGGGNEPFITTYENHGQDARVRDIGDVSPLIGTTASNPDRGNNPLIVAQSYDGYNQSDLSECCHTLRTATGGEGDDKTPKVAIENQAVRMDLHMGGDILTDHAQTVRANASASIGGGVVLESAHGIDRDNQAMENNVQSTLKTPSGGDDVPTCLDTSYIVRRLTPLECERLMGYPDNYTKIPFRGKPAEQCPDSPRYKACGNGWAINCAQFVLQGLDRYLRNLDRRNANGGK